MKELIEKINAEYEAFAKEAGQQAEKGNKAAGTRARKSALELSKLFKEFRKVCLVPKNKNYSQPLAGNLFSILIQSK